jgi:AcrR family transcriptional regulator
MDQRIKTLRSLEPSNSGHASYLAILEAAAGLFGQFPAKDITLRDILSISGVSNQTLYNYFPKGRDDIAIALYDRFQRTMVDNFNHTICSVKGEEVKNHLDAVAFLSACLARSVFIRLKETLALQASLLEYLNIHNLVSVACHSDELEEALARELSLRFGQYFVAAELPRLVRLSVPTVRGIADVAMLNKAFSIDVLESNARKMTRVLLQTGLQGHEGPSGIHGFSPYETGPHTIVAAPISPTKKQGILDRILKRDQRG